MTDPEVRRTGLRGLGDLSRAAAGRWGNEPRLRTSLLVWLAAGVVVCPAFAGFVGVLHGSGALVLTAIGLAWWTLVGAVVTLCVPLLITPEGARVGYLGIPNGLSALRAWLVCPLLMCALLSTTDHVGFYLWCSIGFLAGCLDFVDGFVARSIGPVTALGKAIDPAGDATYFAAAAIGDYALGIVPGWLAILLLVRYLGPLLLSAPVLLLFRRRPEVVHTRAGRMNTGFTGGILTILLFVRLFNGPVNTVALVLSIPTLLPTTLLHFVELWRRVESAPVAAAG